MKTQVQRPQQGKDVHQDEQNHGGHDKCHLQLVVAHPARRFKRVVGSHIIYESRQQRNYQPSEKRLRNTNTSYRSR